MSLLSGLVLAAALSSVDVQRLGQYEAAWGDPTATRVTSDDARRQFGGRGLEIARHFLTHTDPVPRNDAYFFVLRAVGDADTALVLIGALVDPPPRESGLLDRHFGEVSVAIEAVLSNEAVSADPRLVVALERAISSARARPSGAGLPEALEAIRLLGRCRAADVARALSTLSADPDRQIRAAAAEALGDTTRGGAPAGALKDGEAAALASPSGNLIRLLTADPSADARRAAADSLGAIDGTEVGPALRAALAAERDPRVVDSVIQALRRRGMPVDDPAQCHALIGRAWESGVAEQMFACWARRGISREELVQSALTGPAPQRAVALSALTAAEPAPSTQSLIVTTSAVQPRFEPSLGDQLLGSTVWTLSQEDGISTSIRETAERALWDLSGRAMPRALAYADRVTPHAARFRASAALARAGGAAYDSVRRRQQAGIALVLVLIFGGLAAWRARVRRPMMLLALAALAWAAWTLQAGGVRDLPPPPLQALSAAAIAFLSAGATTAAAALRSQRQRRASAAAARGVAIVLAAALLAGAVCAATRIAGLFPSDLSGWDSIFDPLGAAILAFAAAAILVAIDSLVIQRLTHRASSGAP